MTIHLIGMARPLEPIGKAPLRLISAANSNDRFRLLQDPDISLPDIDGQIHPVFKASNFSNASPETYTKMQQTLRLASMFLKYDSVLQWFVPPLLGIPLLDAQTGKSYLSDPLVNKTRSERQKIIRRVRKALNCLSHCLSIQFCGPETDVKFYARTTKHFGNPPHGPACTPHFRCGITTRIEIRKQYHEFLKMHYSTAPIDERLRFDFSLAVGLVHEVCHAVGVMRRNNLTEPHIRLDHPEQPEFGYSFENFMFGGVMNPLDRASSRIGCMVFKVWADDHSAYAAGGKEWAAVPMSYIAQWFQKKTWNIIARRGPAAVPPPLVHLKMRCHNGAYTILSSKKDAIIAVKELQRLVIEQYRPTGRFPDQIANIIMASTEFVPTVALQNLPLPVPSRNATPSVEGRYSTRTGRPFDTMVRSYSNPLPKAEPPCCRLQLSKRPRELTKESEEGSEQAEAPTKKAKH